MAKRSRKDSELLREIAAQFHKAIKSRHLPKEEAARVLGVSRQTLYAYLGATAMPNAEVVARALHAWDVKLNYRGHTIAAEWYGEKGLRRPKPAEPYQLSLLDAIDSLDKRDVEVAITRKDPERIELQVSLKFVG